MKGLLLLVLPFLVSCRNEPAPPPVQPLVLQPRPDWKPGDAPRKLNIMLLLDKYKIRKGETFNYRLETQNVGRKPMPFKERAPSFTKDGSLCGSNGFKLYAALSGEDRLLPCKPAAAPAKDQESGLDLILQPGDYLLTRGSGPSNRFRGLQTDFRFETVGTYRLKAVYAANGFRAVSNIVQLEVVP
jgi:hypothetical protein